MRNPSEILKLAVGGGHYYRPSKPDQPLTPQSFMCIALDSMFHSGVITAEEFEQTAAAVVGYVRELRSEEHTSELQSRENLVCRLLLEKKNTGDKFAHAGHLGHVAFEEGLRNSGLQFDHFLHALGPGDGLGGVDLAFHRLPPTGAGQRA